MANEITTSFGLTLIKGAHVERIEAQQVKFDQAGVGSHKPVVDVGTSEEVLSFGDVATPSLLFVRNLDADNFVTIGPELTGAMVPLIKLDPGKYAFLPLAASVVLRAQADTATIKLLMLVIEA